MRKPACCIIILIIFLSCNNAKEKVIVTNPRPQDSANTVSTDRSSNPYATVDVSPMDMSYFPADYPKLHMSKATGVSPVARVIYSRPHLQGRSLFKDLLKYDEPWRLGANEATELDLYKDVTIQGKKIRAGRYIMYCIPQPDKWTIIFNSNIDTWGLQQDTEKDVEKFIVPVKHTDQRVEYYTMVFEGNPNGADLLMAWDGVEVRLPIQF